MSTRLTLWVESVSRVTICSSVWELEKLRARWKAIYQEGRYTIFQDFDWNLLAARIFSDREVPFIVCAEASYGLAIIPTVRRRDRTLRLLGEELFDYRTFLHQGENSESLIRSALSTLSQMRECLEVVAVRGPDRWSVMDEMHLTPFTEAPLVDCGQISSEEFSATHQRLGRNIRRFQKLGFEVKKYYGDSCDLLRSIYSLKAAQDPASLFRDPCRVEFIIQAAHTAPHRCEIFVLEYGTAITAALVTFRDGDFRRFYTGWFDSNYAKLSPSMSLIYETTRVSLAEGLSCDYMTGTQPYKLRLATGSVPLYRLQATPEQLAVLAEQAAA
jgi:CelD/BcsL family acetyltransferase involved in cellulose biosynthesis